MTRPRRQLPTRDELLLAPELAVLGSLEATVELAIVALVAAQPDLWWTGDRRDALRTAAAHGAADVINAAQVLVAAIARYRACLRSHDASPIELPF